METNRKEKRIRSAASPLVTANQFCRFLSESQDNEARWRTLKPVARRKRTAAATTAMTIIRGPIGSKPVKNRRIRRPRIICRTIIMFIGKNCPCHRRSSRRPLKTTSRLAPMSAKTAIHIVAMPAKVSTMNTPLMPSARMMFCFRIAAVVRDSRTKEGTLRKSSSMSATSAVSIAVSVPAAPIAKPTSAVARAAPP